MDDKKKTDNSTFSNFWNKKVTKQIVLKVKPKEVKNERS